MLIRNRRKLIKLVLNCNTFHNVSKYISLRFNFYFVVLVVNKFIFKATKKFSDNYALVDFHHRALICPSYQKEPQTSYLQL